MEIIVIFCWIVSIFVVVASGSEEVTGEKEEKETKDTSGKDEAIVDDPRIANKNEANGFGDHLTWHSLEEALTLSPIENKPIMLIIHQEWCHACDALKTNISDSQDVEYMSEKFLLVNVDEDNVSKEEMIKYTPDGSYVPRVLFIDIYGNVDLEVVNVWGLAKYKYFHDNAYSVVESMKRMLDHHVRAKGAGDL